MNSKFNAARSALKLGSFVSILTLATLGARLATADVSPKGTDEEFGASAARIAGGDLSNKNLLNKFDPDGSALFARHDPQRLRTSLQSILQGYEDGPPISRWAMAPQVAETVNASLPISTDPILPAKPFKFQGSAVDHEAALTCLTQAVYYEAGFEPIEGAQAVAQVVLNRVRHPIFPKSVCGVVYQGAELKTGCQFSFTCDGSLNRVPAAGAWERAKAVANSALSGFVQKGVGEATHYHTEWMLPWWAPTVSKIAKVGTQIFYRWPGQAGLPGAFVGRYAGGEHVGRINPNLSPSASPSEEAAAETPRVLIAAAPPALELVAPAKVVTASLELASIDAKNAPNVEVSAPHAHNDGSFGSAISKSCFGHAFGAQGLPQYRAC